jgi:hypothetical protein
MCLWRHHCCWIDRQNGLTPLLLAAQHNNFDLVKWLVEEGGCDAVAERGEVRMHSLCVCACEASTEQGIDAVLMVPSQEIVAAFVSVCGLGYLEAASWLRNKFGNAVTRDHFDVCCLCPLPSALCPLPSALCPLPSALCPLPSALCPLPSALCPLPFALCPLPLFRHAVLCCVVCVAER